MSDKTDSRARSTRSYVFLSRRRFTTTAAAAGLVAASGLPIARAQAAPIKVGVILPRSGFMAAFGDIQQKTVEIALPLLAEDGFPAIEVLEGDTESDVKKAGTNAARLIDNGANILMGAFDSGQTTAIAAIAEQRGVPLVINIAAAPPITEQGYQLVFRNFPKAQRIVGDGFRLQKALFEQTGTAPDKGVMLHVNDTFGQAVAGAVGALFPKMEMPYELLEQIPYDPKSRDLSVEIARAKGTGADVLWVVSRLNDAILLTREMVKQRWEPKGIISTGPGYYENQYLKTLGDKADYAFSLVPWFDPNKPMTKRMLAAWQAKHPDLGVDTNVAYTFDAMLTIADAYKRAGSTDAGALRDALRTTNITDNVTIGPGISFDEKGQNETLTDAGIQNRDGAPRVFLPKEAAEVEPVFPVPGWNERA